MNLKDITESDLLTEIERLRQRVAELEAAEAGWKSAMQVVRESEEKYRILLDESSDPIFTFHPDGQYRYVNQAFADGVGKSLDQIIGKKIWDVFPKDEADKRYAVVKWVFENGQTKVLEVRVPRPDGDRYYVTTVKPTLDEQGKVTSVICISKEITDRKQMEQELKYLGSHDLLSGLYNRNFFEIELERIQTGRQFPVSIVLADLDDLKITNDLHGHAKGDELIRQAAHILRRSFRVEDIVARIGGDEFAILLPETDEATAQSTIARLETNLKMQEEALLSLSIGYATGEEGSNLMDILRLADSRMYQDKLTRKKKPIQKDMEI